ncbi:hypothetical protein ACUOCP_52825, partial [Escherichia sp. R-CC3]
MKVEVETPEENTGDVIGDLSRRRGMLKGQESEVTGVKIPAESTLQPEGLLHTRGMAASGLRPL